MGKLNGKPLPEQEKPEIIYVFDALCGWCYGFSPVMEKLYEEFTPVADFLVLSGGLVRQEDARPVREMAEFITHASKIIEDTAGVKFGRKFMEETLHRNDVIFSSVPPASALAVFRLEQPASAVSFASRLQKAIYYDGIRVDDISCYGSIAQEYGLDPKEFVSRMTSEEIFQIVSNEFGMVQGMGVKGFPSLIIRKGSHMEVVARGYKDYNSLWKTMKDLL